MRRSAFASALVLLLAASPAAAAVIGTTGGMTEISAPASTLQNALESDTQIFLFAEQTSVTLGSSLSVDVALDGTYDSGNVPVAGSGSIAPGSVVDSYFIHLDRLGQNAVVSGSVTFDTDILGVIVYTGGLGGSDGLLGAGGTSYISGDPNRGLEFGPSEDVLTLSGSTLTLSLREQQNRVDQLRVVVAGSAPVVPEPDTALLLGSGLLALAAARRTRR
jgi:hypothetical protein